MNAYSHCRALLESMYWEKHMLGSLSLHLASASKDGSCSSAFSFWYQNTYLWRYVPKLESGKGATRKRFATRIDFGEFQTRRIASFSSDGMQLVANSWSFSVVISGFGFTDQYFAICGIQFLSKVQSHNLFMLIEVVVYFET